MPELKITLAAPARDIAQDLIPEVHQHLRNAKILYLFTTQKRKKCDRVRLGSAAKLSAMMRFLSSGMESVEDGHDFIILFDVNEWKELTEAQRRALVDHELCHCGVSATGFRVRGHDIEEFRAVIERHGFWKEDVKYFAEAAHQIPLPVESTVTIQANGESVTVTAAQFEKAARGH